MTGPAVESVSYQEDEILGEDGVQGVGKHLVPLGWVVAILLDVLFVLLAIKDNGILRCLLRVDLHVNVPKQPDCVVRLAYLELVSQNCVHACQAVRSMVLESAKC